MGVKSGQCDGPETWTIKLNVYRIGVWQIKGLVKLDTRLAMKPNLKNFFCVF